MKGSFIVLVKFDEEVVNNIKQPKRKIKRKGGVCFRTLFLPNLEGKKESNTILQVLTFGSKSQLLATRL